MTEGETKEYYDSGKLKSVSNYKGGKQNGLTINYDENGEVTERRNYVDGNLVN